MFDVADILDKAWRDFQKHWPLLVPITLIFVVISIAASLADKVLGKLVIEAAGITDATMKIFVGFGGIVSPIATTVMTMGFAAVCLGLVRGKQVSIGDFFSQITKTVPGFLSYLLYVLGTVVGLVLLVIPGLLFCLLAVFNLWFIADRNTGPVEAIKQSIHATKPALQPMFLYALAALGLLVVGAIPCGLGLLVTVPLLFLASAHVYEALTAGGETTSAR